MAIINSELLTRFFKVLVLAMASSLTGTDTNHKLDITLKMDLVREFRNNYNYSKFTSEKHSSNSYEYICRLAKNQQKAANFIAEQYLETTHENPQALDKAQKDELIEMIKTDHKRYINILRDYDQKKARNNFTDSFCAIDGFKEYSYASTFLLVLVASRTRCSIFDAEARLRRSAASGEYAAIALLALENSISHEKYRVDEDWDWFLYNAVLNDSIKMVKFLLKMKYIHPCKSFGQGSGDNAFGQALIRNNQDILDLLDERCPLNKMINIEFVQNLIAFAHQNDCVGEEIFQHLQSRIPPSLQKKPEQAEPLIPALSLPGQKLAEPPAAQQSTLFDSAAWVAIADNHLERRSELEETKIPSNFEPLTTEEPGLELDEWEFITTR